MAMAKYDLTPKIAPNLDRHLVFPLLEFTQERELYPNDQILKDKIELLNNTNMVDNAMDIHKSLYHTDEVPRDMVDRKADVVARLKSLEEAAGPLIMFFQNPNAVRKLRADKQYNLKMLSERYLIGPEQIEALYRYSKFQFECGNYAGAADYFYQYRALSTNAEKSLSALWGKLAAEILMENWDIALEELNHLQEIIDSKNFTSSANQVQSRIRLMHWSLFIFFNHYNGRTQIIDLFNQDKYLNCIQTNAPHLLRYLATAFIVNKKKRPQFKEFIKLIQQEQHSFADPITEFLACVFVNFDFDGAQKKMKECEDVILNDPFLGKRVEESSYTVVPLKDEFLENARLFIFETYCRIHEIIDMRVLAEKLNLNYEDAEMWILNLIRTSKINAKIVTQAGTVVMEPNHSNVADHRFILARDGSSMGEVGLVTAKDGSAMNNNGLGDGTKQNGNDPNQKGPLNQPNLHADNGTEQEPKSYASVFKEAVNISKKSTLRFIAPSVTVSGSKRAVIPDDLVLKQANRWSITLVGYFVGKQPTFPFVKLHAKQLWKKFGLEDVILNDQGYFFLKFMSEQGMQHVLENGPWWFNDIPILLKRWQPGIWFDKPTATVVPLWVNIYDIPIDLWNYEILSHIVSVIGVPISMDRYTSEMCEKKKKRTSTAIYSRVLVEISSEEEVPLFIEAEILGTVRKFKLRYDWTPPRCSHCVIFGHKFSDCIERSDCRGNGGKNV